MGEFRTIIHLPILGLYVLRLGDGGDWEGTKRHLGWGLAP